MKTVLKNQKQDYTPKDIYWTEPGWVFTSISNTMYATLLVVDTRIYVWSFKDNIPVFYGYFGDNYRIKQVHGKAEEIHFVGNFNTN